MPHLSRRPRRLLAACLLLLLLPAAPGARADADRWRTRLGRPDPDELWETIQAIETSKDLDAGEPLLEVGLETPYPHLAVACGEALAAIDYPGEEKDRIRDAERWLKKAMRTREESELKNLARMLGPWGHPMVDEHLGRLAGGRLGADVQAEALMMCAAIPHRGDGTFEEIAESVAKAVDRGRSEDIKVAACSAAGARGDRSVIEDLVQLVRRERDEYTGLYAVWALKKLGYDQGIGTFLHVLQKGNPGRETRQACLKAVTELARLSDVPDLLGLTRSSKKDYRDAAALALGRLAWRGEFGQQVITGEGGHPDAVDVPDEVIERLVSMVEDEDEWEVRDAARQSLLRIGEPAADHIRAELPSSLGASDQDTRLTAMELCGLFGVQEAYRDLYKACLYDDSFVIRMFAARALDGVDAEKAAGELLEVAKKAGSRARDYELHAVRALGYLRHRAAFDGLLELIVKGLTEDGRDEEDELLRQVEFALERLTGHRFGRKPDIWHAWIEEAEAPFNPRLQKYDRSRHRSQVVGGELYGLSRNTERAVESGLRWLERQQHAIGLWDGNEKGFGGVVGCEPAYTGLSLLAFLGAGYNGQQGKYRETIRRAAEFLAATQFYDGGYPVTGGGDESWIFAYLISMGIWGITEGYALSGDDDLAEPAQWGVDYLVRVQTPGGGWRYGPRYVQSDTSCTSWVLMTLKAADMLELQVAQKSFDGIDSWLERCSFDITGEVEMPADLSTDYEHEVGYRRYFKAFTGYFELSGSEKSAAQQTSMTAVGMVCRFFMGWKRSHPYMIGSANYLVPEYLPTWMRGLERGQAVAWYHYYWYYGTLAMHQMGGRYWRAWNAKIKRMYPENQRRSPPELEGSWDPDTAVLNGGRLFSTAMSILTLETYYRFSPLLGEPGVSDGLGEEVVEGPDED